MTSYYPVFLNINKRKCVVVGGGLVAMRKVQSLLECGADVTVISPDLCAGLQKMAEEGDISPIRRSFRAGDLAGAFLAIVATNWRGVNEKVAEEGRQKSVMVNVADDAENSNFIVPSNIRKGNLIIAISTSGRSPALARKLRVRIEEQYGNVWGELTDVVGEVRSEIRCEGIKVSTENWQKALDLDTIVKLLKNGDRGKAKTFLRDTLLDLSKDAKES